MKTALIFPGQGSQFVGMGKDLYDNFIEAKEVFEEVDDTLNQHLSKLIFFGDLNELTLTQNAQPAIMVTSIATLKVIEKQSGKNISQLCSYVCGHSLGEYSAHGASGSMSLQTIANLLKLRGSSMAESALNSDSGMIALIGVDIDQAEKLVAAASSFGLCEIANDNGAGQIVISGYKIALNWAKEHASEFNIRRAIELNVGGAFHSQLMKPAALAMENGLSEMLITKPKVNLVANFTANLVSEPDMIRSSLVSQITNRVRWRESMEYLSKNEVNQFIEVGPGKVLSTIAKRMNDQAKVFAISTTDDLEVLLNN